MKIINICFIIATICIVYLTYLGGTILKSSIESNNALCLDNTFTFSSDYTQTTRIDTSLVSFGAKNNAHGVSSKFTSERNHESILDSIVSNLTLAVNSVNNILTSGSIFVAILTLFIGLMGLYGFHSLKNDAQKTKDDIQIQLEEFSRLSENNIITINRLQDEHKKFLGDVNSIKYSLIQHEIYLAEKTIKYLYNTTYALGEQIKNKKVSKKILDNLVHSFQIASLYRINLEKEDSSIINDKFAAFAYLEVNGVIDDIPDLEYVVQYDPNTDNKRRAVEIIALIKNKKQLIHNSNQFQAP